MAKEYKPTQREGQWENHEVKPEYSGGKTMIVWARSRGNERVAEYLCENAVDERVSKRIKEGQRIQGIYRGVSRHKISHTIGDITDLSNKKINDLLLQKIK